jgi:hypothetical protein
MLRCKEDVACLKAPPPLSAVFGLRCCAYLMHLGGHANTPAAKKWPGRE